MRFPIRVRAGAIIIENKSILLVEFTDENGLHYNLPGGGVEKDESVTEAVIREAKEETGVKVRVGQLAFVYEYAPHLVNDKYGPVPSLSLFFNCKIIGDNKPKLPSQPDRFQTGVKWIPMKELGNIVLYPDMKKDLLAYAQNQYGFRFIQEK